MEEFLGAVGGFPGVVFSAALLVVIGFWLLVLFGGFDADGFDADADLGALGMGGVPVAVPVSLMVVIGWFTSVTGAVLLGRSGIKGVAHLAADGGVFLLSVLMAWWLTRSVVRPLAKLFPDEPGPSRQDFIGSTCTIRTGRVEAGFGQAEVTARDGSTAIVQVRQEGTDAFVAGSTALLYAYDDTGEFFLVAPYDAALDPGPGSGGA
ncbi:hypothetical protein AB0I94_33805 [Streptomyces sp. NPDC050147]|uniref:hypothetical protein n=1 Tax=Streptomyces sp. NPDC050147 TaxID=3155513 RepID=UPI0034223FAF